jgi:hypothetical protein
MATPKNKRRKAKVNPRRRAKANRRTHTRQPSDLSIRFPRRTDSNISPEEDKRRRDSRSVEFVLKKLRGVSHFRPESYVIINPDTRQIDFTEKPKPKSAKGVRLPRLKKKPRRPRKKNDILGKNKGRKV